MLDRHAHFEILSARTELGRVLAEDAVLLALRDAGVVITAPPLFATGMTRALGLVSLVMRRGDGRWLGRHGRAWSDGRHQEKAENRRTA